MNIFKTFKDWMVTESIATSGQITISRVNSGRNTPETKWWLTADGGADLGHNVTGESTQTTVIGVHLRDKEPEQVYDRLEALRDSVTCAGCLTLTGYEVVRPPTTTGPFTDQDLDDEDRTVGLLQIELTINKEC